MKHCGSSQPTSTGATMWSISPNGNLRPPLWRAESWLCGGQSLGKLGLPLSLPWSYVHTYIHTSHHISFWPSCLLLWCWPSSSRRPFVSQLTMGCNVLEAYSSRLDCTAHHISSPDLEFASNRARVHVAKLKLCTYISYHSVCYEGETSDQTSISEPVLLQLPEILQAATSFHFI